MKMIVNPYTVFITLVAYFVVGISYPAIGSPVQSKVKINKQEFLKSLETDLLKTGLSKETIQHKFQGLTNKDIVALYSGVKANVAAGGDPAIEALGMIFLLLLISASVGALAEQDKNKTYK